MPVVIVFYLAIWVFLFMRVVAELIASKVFGSRIARIELTGLLPLVYKAGTFKGIAYKIGGFLLPGIEVTWESSSTTFSRETVFRSLAIASRSAVMVLFLFLLLSGPWGALEPIVPEGAGLSFQQMLAMNIETYGFWNGLMVVFTFFELLLFLVGMFVDTVQIFYTITFPLVGKRFIEWEHRYQQKVNSILKKLPKDPDNPEKVRLELKIPLWVVFAILFGAIIIYSILLRLGA